MSQPTKDKCYVCEFDLSLLRQDSKEPCHSCKQWHCLQHLQQFEFCRSQICRDCLHHKYSVDLLSPVCPICKTGGVDQMVHIATRMADFTLLDQLAVIGANFDVRERSCYVMEGWAPLLHKGRTPLFYAVLSENLDLVRRLINLGGKVTALSHRNPDADIDLFELANNLNNPDILDLLIESLDDVEIDHEYLCFAARNGHQDLVQQLLDIGQINPNQKNWMGDTPLFTALYAGHSQIANMLMQYPPDPDIKNINGASVTEIAKLNGFVDMDSILDSKN
jgi:hypothetical protein